MMTQIKSLWRNRDFLVVWGGQSISMFGTRVSYIAWIWWVLTRTDSPTAVAAIGISAALPSLLLGPIAGAIDDRLDRRKIMMAMDLINAAVFGAAAFLMFCDLLVVWHVYVLTALSATAMAFHRPSLQSSIPNLVSGDQLTRANSFYQISRGVCGLVGLFAGGILVGTIGVVPTLWLDATTFLIAGLSLLFVAFPSPRTSQGESWRRILQDTISGFRFLLSRKSLFYLILLFALINFLLAPIGVLLSLMSKDVFNAGPQGLGALNAAIAVGLLVGGFLTASLKRFQKRGAMILLGLLAIGVLIALFGVSTNLYVSLGVLAVLGIFIAIVNVLESVIYQTRVPNELQGRVFAAQFAVCDGLQPVSLAAIGGLLVVFSAPVVLIGSGVAVILAVLGTFSIKGIQAL
ncbi:MFS transporter [Candidatus Bipolaricaulota bacterium]